MTYGFPGLKSARVTAVVTTPASAAVMRPAFKSRSVRKSVSSGGVLIECAWRGEFILLSRRPRDQGLPQTITAVNLPLGEPIGELTAWEVNRKLKGFRTTYSIFYLLENGQTDELAQF